MWTRRPGASRVRIARWSRTPYARQNSLRPPSRPSIGRDWSVLAGQLEWNVEYTIEHIAATLSKYTLYLASRSKEFIAVRIASRVGASQRERLDAIPSLGRALANVASMTSPDVRVFHASGMLDGRGLRRAWMPRSSSPRLRRGVRAWSPV